MLNKLNCLINGMCHCSSDPYPINCIDVMRHVLNGIDNKVVVAAVFRFTAMEAEAQVETDIKLVAKHSHKAAFISLLTICVLIIVCVGVFYIVTHENSQFDYDDYFFDDSTPDTAKWAENEEIQIFRRYLRFKTVSLSTDFDKCVKFLKKLASDLDLEVSVLYPVNEDNPVVVMTWTGSHCELPSIMLSSHMDVVPAMDEYWTYPPFDAKIDAANGDIYARGAQNMKSIGMQYLAAIRALKRRGIKQLKRTIHIVYVPDGETGGEFGMAPFVKSDFFKKMNIGFGLDDGYPSSDENLSVYYAEKSHWKIIVTAYGHSGHASILFGDTAGEKLNFMIEKFMEYRRNEMIKWKKGKKTHGKISNLSNITTINLTILNGGHRGNVIPSVMSAYFDVRLAIHADGDIFEKTIKGWASEAGENVEVVITRGLNTPPTVINDSNQYWMAFKKATHELEISVTPAVYHAGSGNRYLRDLLIPALGFSPIMNTTPLLFEYDEYINADVYLRGIDIYKKIIQEIGNID